MDIADYRTAYPLKSENIAGKEFRYRHLRNEASETTVVCLVGGIGLSDLAYSLCARLSEHYSVITFDYPEAYPTLDALSDAVAELLRRLGIRAYFLGQSLGGMVAQLMQIRHPEVVSGLVLSNTGTLSAELGEEGLECYRRMMQSQRKAYRLIRILPFAFLKRSMRKGIEAKFRDNPEEERRVMRAMLELTMELLTKRYELHMIRLLLDIEGHLNARKPDFAALSGRVLILSADDDATFCDDIKRVLEASMTDPMVHRFARGGHLAPFIHVEETLAAVKGFIGSQ